MKKFIIMLAVLCCTGVFAATPKFLGFGCKDVTAMEAAIKNTEVMAWQKVVYSVKLAIAKKPDAFASYAALKTFVAEKYKEFAKGSNMKAWFPAQIVYSIKQLSRFNREAFEDCRNTFYGIYFALYNKTDMSTQEIWRYLGNRLIEDNYSIGNHQRLTRVVNYMINHDLRIQKAEKIEVYNMLYEKYLPKITDEQNLTNDKKVYTPILSKIAMKLKALGVNVIK